MSWRKFLVGVVVLFFCFGANAQKKNDKWVLGLGGSFIKFSETSTAFPGESFNFQIPNIFITRYIQDGFSVEGGVTLPVLKGVTNLYSNKFEIMSIDAYGSYDFKRSEEIFVPRVMLGASLLIKDLVSKAIFLDVGVGATYWLTSRVGLNSKIVYKQLVAGGSATFDSHMQFSGALVFSLSDYRKRTRRGAGFCSY
ncbi:hypothetical protein [Flavicella sediminum]|uniref:hypothetical protein n=1 Tax=Flavicella sediminum TaxID=2585141 RepID=UPI00111F913B|nr:hypothetical protein [Flavicella sediminum]